MNDPASILTSVVYCENCGKPALIGIEPHCRACYWPHAKYAPNVRLASSLHKFLEDRFSDTRADAERNGWDALFAELNRVGAESRAVVAVDAQFAFDFFSLGRTLYASYSSPLGAGTRAPASYENDSKRLSTDAWLYGIHGSKITFAALSADGRGLSGWGPIFIELSELAIGYRATVLESNSYSVTSSLSATSVESLRGHIAVWSTRNKLVVAKLGPRLGPENRVVDLARELLSPNAGRADADFLEVHIYGPFNHQAVEAVRVSHDAAISDPVAATLFDAFLETAEQLIGKPIETV